MLKCWIIKKVNMVNLFIEEYDRLDSRRKSILLWYLNLRKDSNSFAISLSKVQLFLIGD